jgi:hypothetical protein
MIYYKEMIVDAVEPSSPGLGDIWICQLATTYQAYIWLNSWIPFTSGGVYVAEPDADTHYINVIIQSTEPTSSIRPGWIWINSATLQAYLYIFGYMFLAGA